MQYIKPDARGFMSYDAYFSYLATIKNELGNDLFLFASDPERHNLSSPRSLHDAWIEALSIRTFYQREPDNLSTPDVKLALLGPYHDRIHTLSYFQVQACRINFDFCSDGRKRDLLHHELRYANACIEHEFVFDGDMTIEIVCHNARHEEHLIAGKNDAEANNQPM